MKPLRLTMGQALIRFLDNQYLNVDGEEIKFISGAFGIFGHGSVLGIGEALQQGGHSITYYKGCSEQGMANAAVAYGKQSNRRRMMAVVSSIGPGASNMITSAALATINRIPLLLLPGDTFACRQPDPVLQQLESFDSLSTTVNDAFKPVCRYWDRIVRPEQLMSAAINAIRVLANPATTGAVCLSLPQDVQSEAYDYPESFFEKRVIPVERPQLSQYSLDRVVGEIERSSTPMVICGGGVRYSDAASALATFCEKLNIPFAETQAGKGCIEWDHPMNLGGVGVTGNLSANRIAAGADLVIGVGTRFSDFTTCSKWLFKHPELRVVTLNINDFDAYKLNATPSVCDARSGLEQLTEALLKRGYRSGYTVEIEKAKADWGAEVDRLYFGSETATDSGGYSQMRALGELNESLLPEDAIVVGASGSLPGDLQRFWQTKEYGGYHLEYGFSCMGYEVNGALGAKLAEPDREVYAMVGDAAFVMLHSELLTSLQEGIKINILLFDNNGFGCIDNLQRSQGLPQFGCELRYRNPKTGKLDGGDMVPVDYAKIAEGYGCFARRVTNTDELRTAIRAAQKSPISTLIDIKVDPNSMSGGYGSWWRVAPPEVSENKATVAASEEIKNNLTDALMW